MKKIILSLSVIAAVAAVVVGATTAFYNDEETSTGNTFTAGAIDLKIDNESYAIDYNIPEYVNPIGAFVKSTSTSWQLADLTIEKFFNFVDLKPGDIGEDTISIHVDSNNAWLCASARITADNDVTYTEPEIDDDTATSTDGIGLGELDQNLNFIFWADDGDNVLENCYQNDTNGCVDETQKVFITGTLSDMNKAGQIALADSRGGIFGGPIPGGAEVFIGKAWCFGAISQTPLPQDGSGNSRTPLTGTGIACDGTNVNNASQTDMVMGDIQFYAEQSRNNDEFKCSEWTPNWGDE